MGPIHFDARDNTDFRSKNQVVGLILPSILQDTRYSGVRLSYRQSSRPLHLCLLILSKSLSY